MSKDHPEYTRLGEAIESRHADAKGRPYAYLAEKLGTTEQRVGNWSLLDRGVPKNIKVRDALRKILGLASLEELNDILSGDASTALTPAKDKDARLQIWSLPLVQGDQLKIVQYKNDHDEVTPLPKFEFATRPKLDQSQDKVVILQREIGGMKAGDYVVMRPKPPGPVTRTVNAVVVQTPGGETFVMEYDRDQIAGAGLTVIAYAVAHVPAETPPSGVII